MFVGAFPRITSQQGAELVRQLQGNILSMWMIAKLAPEGRLSASFLRSARRALQRLVETEWLITTGNGGPGDPLPYSIQSYAD